MIRRFANPGVLALLFCCLLVAVVYFTHDRDPLAFVIMGARFSEGDLSASKGYDGQFAYYIARDPVGAVDYLDNPAYRYQRILYPMLARLLALGQVELIPWTLLAVNVISISVSTACLGCLLERQGFNPYVALLLPLWLGQVFALRADLNEPLCYLCVLLALWGYERGRHGLAAAALAASVLAKEGGFLFLPPIVLVLRQRRQWRLCLLYILAVLLPYAVLQLGLYAWMGRIGLERASGRFEVIPFYGFTFTQPLAARVFLILLLVGPAAVLLSLAAVRLVRTPQSMSAWALLFNCLFVVFLARRTAIDVLAVFRVATGVVIAALLFCSAHRLRFLARILLAIWLPPVCLAGMIPGFLV